MQILLSNSQAGPGRTVKQEKEEISRNHIQAFIPGSVHIPWNADNIVFELIQLGASDGDGVVAGPARVEVDVPHARRVVVARCAEIHQWSVDRGLHMEFISIYPLLGGKFS